MSWSPKLRETNLNRGIKKFIICSKNCHLFNCTLRWTPKQKETNLNCVIKKVYNVTNILETETGRKKFLHVRSMLTQITASLSQIVKSCVCGVTLSHCGGIYFLSVATTASLRWSSYPYRYLRLNSHCSAGQDHQ